MSRRKTNWYSLPPLQRQILIHLAKEGPKTRNEVAQELGSAYKNILFSFNSLKRKGLIKQIGEKKHRQRSFPQYWLSEDGVILAFIEGTPKGVLIEKAKEFYPDNENLNSFIDFASVFNPDVWKIAFASIKRKGKLEPIDLATIMITQMESDANLEKLKEGLIQLKKYPEILESFMKLLEGLDKVKAFVSEVLGHE
jgi:DNA-binding Lrp family transcriptional regulator